MKIGAIIAEYNPFHNGHRYQIEKFRQEQQLDYILIIMSGNFTQRGEPAWMPKYLRTRAALMGGADLVIELPAYYATGSASLFAEGAVSHLNALNCIDMLCFGCEVRENEEIHREQLKKAAALLAKEPEEFKQELSRLLKTGLSYPSARAAALDKFIEYPEFLSLPNNILALEYMLALKKTGSGICPFPIQRKGEGYHSTKVDEIFTSASALRQSLGRPLSIEDFKNIPETHWIGIPEETRRMMTDYYGREFPMMMDDFTAMFAAAFMRSSDKLTTCPDMNDDLAHRMRRCFDHYVKLTDFLMEVKNKAYTYSRLSRCASHILLEQNKEILNQARHDGYAYYARILGFRKSAAPLLNCIKKRSDIPLIGKMADSRKILRGNGLQLMKTDVLAADYYRTALQIKYGNVMKNEFNQGIIII